MAERAGLMNLMPSLLDRLIDDEPALAADYDRHWRALEALMDPAKLNLARSLIGEDHRSRFTPERAREAGLDEVAPAAIDHLNAMIELERRRRYERKGERAYSLEELQEAVLRDLDWLLNTENMSSLGGDDDVVASSVLNYGMAPLLGRALDDLRADGGGIISAEIRRAVRRFEPRLDPDRLNVRIAEDDSADPRRIRLQIECELLAEPAPLRLLVDTVFDAEEARFRVEATP